MNYPILDKAIQELNKEYGTDFQYKIYNGRFWLWDANGVYSSEWYYNNIDYQNEVDPILTKLNEAVVNQFNNDDLFVDYWNFSKMYISGLHCEDEEELTEDDRHELARRGEIVNTSNRNEVSSDNRYTEETRKILEKIGKIAKATAEKLGWDEGLVFQDMIRDLQLLGNPALVEQLDPSNPIDQMTKQVLEMQLSGLLGDGNDYELFKSSTLTALMRMDEQQAANQLYQMFNRGQITGGNYQRIENRNQRALPNRNSSNDSEVKDDFYSENALEQLKTLKKKYDIDSGYKKETDEGFFEIIEKDKNNPLYVDIMSGADEEAQIIDSTKDYIMVFWRKYDQGHDPRDLGDQKAINDDKNSDEAFAEKFGADNLIRYKRLTQKLEGNNRDITWVIAHIENKDDLNEMLNVTEFGEYNPIAENDKFIVFDIDSLNMCQRLARGTTWCITSPTAYNTNARFGARYHFYINKITGEKYCVAMVGGMNEIVDANDNELARLPEDVPQVGEEEVRSSVVNEDKSSSEALLQTALANVNLLPVETLRVAYDDMFGDELDMLEDEEVQPWLLEKLPEVDLQELKTYIEEHIDDFAIVQEENSDEEEIDYEDEEEIPDLSEVEVLEEETETQEITREEIVEFLKNELSKNKLTELGNIIIEDDNTIIKLKFSDEAYNLMVNGTADNFYRKEMNITVFDAEANESEYFEIVVNRLGNEEDRIWLDENTDFKFVLKDIVKYFDDKEIKSIIEEQNEVYE